MGQIKKLYKDEIIDEACDRYANAFKVRMGPSNEVVIQLRNLKIVLLTEKERREWKEGMKEALSKFKAGNYLSEDDKLQE